MGKWIIKHSKTGHEYGVYEADDQLKIFDMWARDQGAKDFNDALRLGIINEWHGITIEKVE